MPEVIAPPRHKIIARLFTVKFYGENSRGGYFQLASFNFSDQIKAFYERGQIVLFAKIALSFYPHNISDFAVITVPLIFYITEAAKDIIFLSFPAILLSRDISLADLPVKAPYKRCGRTQFCVRPRLSTKK